MATRREMTERVRAKALELGFDACGVVRAEPLADERARLLSWLVQGRQAEMDYMSRNTEKRLDPTQLVPGSKSVIVVLLNYYPGDLYEEGSELPRISCYAVGRDYHRVIKKKLNVLLAWINEELAPAGGRVFVDSAPVMERTWAQRAGLGWRGKNSLLLTRQGSWFFIGEIITTLELAYDQGAVTDHCGTCTRCVDACPTGAILPERTVDANRCISYWTIEYPKEQFPGDVPGDFRRQIFGCDICQEVCPWNRKAPEHKTPDFLPKRERLRLTRDDWLEMTEERFADLFAGTPVMRTGLKNVQRNVKKGI